MTKSPNCRRARFFIFLFAAAAAACTMTSAQSQNGLPWTSDFETGDFSEWNRGSSGALQVVQDSPHGGSHCARAVLTAGTHSDNYADQVFGDFWNVGLDKVEEIWVRMWSKFEAGYVWPNDGHKILIFNLTDGQVSQRRYQVIVKVENNGRYGVVHSDIADWRFYGLSQNLGDPLQVRFGQWDKLKLYVRLNTPGQADGVVKLWINDALKLSYDNVDIRESTSYGINKLIMSSYATDASGSDGMQYYDDWSLSSTDPDGGGSPAPDAPDNLRRTDKLPGS